MHSTGWNWPPPALIHLIDADAVWLLTASLTLLPWWRSMLTTDSREWKVCVWRICDGRRHRRSAEGNAIYCWKLSRLICFWSGFVAARHAQQTTVDKSDTKSFSITIVSVVAIIGNLFVKSLFTREPQNIRIIVAIFTMFWSNTTWTNWFGSRTKKIVRQLHHWRVNDEFFNDSTLKINCFKLWIMTIGFGEFRSGGDCANASFRTDWTKYSYNYHYHLSSI